MAPKNSPTVLKKGFFVARCYFHFFTLLWTPFAPLFLVDGRATELRIDFESGRFQLCLPTSATASKCETKISNKMSFYVESGGVVVGGPKYFGVVENSLATMPGQYLPAIESVQALHKVVPNQPIDTPPEETKKEGQKRSSWFSAPSGWFPSRIFPPWKKGAAAGSSGSVKPPPAESGASPRINKEEHRFVDMPEQIFQGFHRFYERCQPPSNHEHSALPKLSPLRLVIINDNSAAEEKLQKETNTAFSPADTARLGRLRQEVERQKGYWALNFGEIDCSDISGWFVAEPKLVEPLKLRKMVNPNAAGSTLENAYYSIKLVIPPKYQQKFKFITGLYEHHKIEQH